MEWPQGDTTLGPGHLGADQTGEDRRGQGRLGAGVHLPMANHRLLGILPPGGSVAPGILAIALRDSRKQTEEMAAKQELLGRVAQALAREPTMEADKLLMRTARIEADSYRHVILAGVKPVAGIETAIIAWKRPYTEHLSLPTMSRSAGVRAAPPPRPGRVRSPPLRAPG